MAHVHPDRPNILCDNGLANHFECDGWDESCQEYVSWPNPDYVVPKKVAQKAAGGRMRSMATQVAPAPRTAATDGLRAGIEGSERAASKWDEGQKQMVDEAIKAVCQRHAGGHEFTSDAIWDVLNGAVPVTKGLTARITKAINAGWMDTTGKTEISKRGGQHDHGQRLTVWYSLL